MTEAVIQFQCERRAPRDAEAAHAAARTLGPLLRMAQELGIMGRDPARYDGLAFGNLSLSSGADGFWISATQTADVARFGADDVVLIEAWDLEANRVEARGAHDPSSETLSHAAIHDVRWGQPTWVVHGHAPLIWSAAHALGLPVTDPAAANGTVAMARAVRDRTGEEPGLIVMGGHRDGVLAYAEDGPAALAMFQAALHLAGRSSTREGRE